MTRTAGRTVTAVVAALLLGGGAAHGEDVRAGLQSPLKNGARPGCHWVQGQPKTTRVCSSTTGQCRTQTAPAQRIWSCGTVRD